MCVIINTNIITYLGWHYHTSISWKLQIIKSDRFAYSLIAIIFVWHIFLDDFNFHIENNIFNHYDIVDIL